MTTEETSPLVRRYRRLLRIYPAGYRAERGDEIVGTYLDLVDPKRRWPSPADAADLLRGGLRERLRGYGALGLATAVPVAATLALHTLITLALFLLLQVEFADVRQAELTDRIGPVQTVGAVVWAGWLLVGLVVLALPGRWGRRAALGALLLTVVVPTVATLVGQPRPPLFVLIPAAALGLATLALPDRPGWVGRLLPLVAAGIGGGTSAAYHLAQGNSDWFTSYRSTPELLGMAGGLLFGLAVVIAIGRAAAGDDSGLWTALLLTVPAGLLGTNQLAQAYWSTRGGGPTWWMLAATAGVVTLAGATLLAAAITLQAVRHRAVRRRVLAGPCPTCGHHPTPDSPA
ncbi:GlsB/YeaQ/YmgE family stress response membrane protein [Plantactinospora sp. B24E8]|uniref:GlsB/YeaQ/YmgE family stress response membrane protein n=1 Tax=Plantactinospora sp. B24E8 TaxID=3153567 RepID=UPI00325CAD86